MASRCSGSPTVPGQEHPRQSLNSGENSSVLFTFSLKLKNLNIVKILAPSSTLHVKVTCHVVDEKSRYKEVILKEGCRGNPHISIHFQYVVTYCSVYVCLVKGAKGFYFLKLSTLNLEKTDRWH